MKEFVEMFAITAKLITDLEEIEYKKQKLRSKTSKKKTKKLPKPKLKQRTYYDAYLETDYKQIEGGK